ncbi:c-type cytochrome [Salinarimonas ramus]|uniref:Cytochrome c-556 n=1 Tax=Salinarimonas ramus TaxID=690164 RepID=A0A917V6W0_9HYPH|nr:cytochrome c [Salinarimonas ramus]GGK44850.1 cytochrome c-556 [Salinarimonas ramus]
MPRMPHLAAAIALASFAAAPLLLGPAAIAQGDPIAERQEIMKGVGDATRTGVQMVRGERDFDLEAARNTFAVYLDASQRMPELFPEGTETGGDTEALPAIWEEKEDFVALFEEFGERAQAGLDDTTDATTFQAALGTATQSCRTCHEQFRMQN